MSVRELRHDKPSAGWFSKSRGLSASVSFLSSPPPPRSFTFAPFFARSLNLVPRSLLLNRTETPATQARNDTECKRPTWRQRIQHYPLWRPFTMTDDVFCLWTEILILETKKRNTCLRRHLTYERYSLYIYHLKRYYSWRRLLPLVGLNWVSFPPCQGYEMWPKFHFFLCCRVTVYWHTIMFPGLFIPFFVP